MHIFLILTLMTGGLYSQSAPSYNKIQAAAVDILVDGNLSGSAAIISEDGYVLTAAHVFVKKAKIEVVNHKNERFNAKMIAIDRGHDIALVKIDSNKKFSYLSLAENGLKAGQVIYHFGSAFFRRGMLQNAFVSEEKPSFEYYGGNSHHSVKVFHASATMQPGTSGGPWLNAAGKLVGVQSGIMIINKSNSGMTYISPLEAIKKLINEKKSAKTPTTEIIVESLWNQKAPVIANYPGYKNAVVVVGLQNNGVGAKAGLKKDDLIYEVNGKKVNTDNEYHGKIRSFKANEIIEVSFFRPSENKTYKIKVPLKTIEEKFAQIFED